VAVGEAVATLSAPDVDVVGPRPAAAGAAGRGLDWVEPPAGRAGRRVDGEEAVEGGAVVPVWPAAGSEVDGPLQARRLLKLPPARTPSGRALAATPGAPADGGAEFELRAPAALTEETRSLRW